MRNCVASVEMFEFLVTISSLEPNIFRRLQTGSNPLVLRSTEERLSLKETLEKAVASTHTAELMLRLCIFVTIQEVLASDGQVLVSLWYHSQTDCGCEGTIERQSIWRLELTGRYVYVDHPFLWSLDALEHLVGILDRMHDRDPIGTQPCTGLKFKPMSPPLRNGLTNWMVCLLSLDSSMRRKLQPAEGQLELLLS